MQTLKKLAAGTLGLALTLGAGAALAKGHDQGVADGSRTDPSSLRGGVVASQDVPGVGRDADGNFLGVADSANSDLTYGRNVVQQQIADDTRRVHPVVGNGGIRK
ncbi:MAG: hypothetical protein HKN19_19450 [Halioglobus sp.]|nr:hypothetical protein [Halioglobus sp.]